MEFTKSLTNLPKMRFNDVERLVAASSLTPGSKQQKGYKFFIEQYLFDYEGKVFVICFYQYYNILCTVAPPAKLNTFPECCLLKPWFSI